jgi:hypothetical protein
LCQCPEYHIFDDAYKLEDSQISLDDFKKEIMENEDISEIDKKAIYTMTNVKDIQEYIEYHNIYDNCDCNCFRSECPICSMVNISNHERRTFLSKIFIDENNIDTFIQSKFKTHKNFEDFLSFTTKERSRSILKELTEYSYHED